MDVKTLLNRRISDHESLLEFSDALSDQLPSVERSVADIRKSRNDKVAIANLFRALHTIKGDAAMCKVSMGVQIAHPIESLLARVRSGEIVVTDALAEAIMLAMDRLEIAVKALIAGRPIENLKLVELVSGFEALAGEKADALDTKADALIEAVTGFRASRGAPRARTGELLSSDTPEDDLEFFRSLALQYENRSPLFRGRSERQLKLALETNEVAGNLIETQQLEAAVYMHDIGMLFLPETLWLKAGQLTELDRHLLHLHPGYAAGLLARMGGWQMAARIVQQHHERQDGAGYPSHLRGDQIVPGAKLLAIIDTFESVTLKHSQHGEGRSMVRAIAEVNACDDQFDPQWITAFNTVIRRMVEG